MNPEVLFFYHLSNDLILNIYQMHFIHISVQTSDQTHQRRKHYQEPIFRDLLMLRNVILAIVYVALCVCEYGYATRLQCGN